MPTADLISTITCPHCGCQRAETMPTNACVHFYECTGCGRMLSPRAGDCCVFCSYGSRPCPPKCRTGIDSHQPSVRNATRPEAE